MALQGCAKKMTVAMMLRSSKEGDSAWCDRVWDPVSIIYNAIDKYIRNSCEK